MNQIDVRGYSCPEPVLMTKRALQKGRPLTVLTDNMTCVQNITRFANNQKLVVKCKEVGGEYELTIE